ncbi:hypothetical protein P7C73_g3301, partial [Tremellales sp. Uapishka_1]
MASSSRAPDPLDDIHPVRFRHVASLDPPAVMPAEYTGPPSEGTTIINPDKIPKGKAPMQLQGVGRARLTKDLRTHLESAMRSDKWPSHLFAEGGSVAQSIVRVTEEAKRIRPSGESGVSHYLKSALFDHMNVIMWRWDFPGQDRLWRVIGIGKTGKTDWGLFINGLLVAVVEVKPNCKVNAGAMDQVINLVVAGKGVDTLGTKKGMTADHLLLQMYAQFSNETAGQVRYAVLLNESNVPFGENRQPAYSSALLFERCADHIAIASSVIGSAAASIFPPEDVISSPAALILALSLAPKEVLIIETSDVPPHPILSGPISAKQHISKTSAPGPPPSTIDQPRPSQQTTARGQDPSFVGRRGRSRPLEDTGSSSKSTARSSSPSKPSGRKKSQHQEHHGDAGMQEDQSLVERTSLTHVQPARKKRYTVPANLVSPSAVASTFHAALRSRIIPVGHDDSSSDTSNSSITTDKHDGLSTPITTPITDSIELESLASVLIDFGDFLPQHLAISDQTSLFGPVSCTFARGRNLPEIHGSGRPIDPLSTSQVYRIKCLLGEGAVWSAFLATSDIEMDIVLKICSPPCCQAVREEDDDDWEDMIDAARQHIRTELDVVTTDLVNLQGTVIPRLHAMYVSRWGEKEVWAEATEYAGRPVRVELLFYWQKLHILELYEAIHQQGILHGDVKPDNWLQLGEDSSDTRFRLSDFGHAQRRSDMSIESWESQRKREVRQASELLNV